MISSWRKRLKDVTSLAAKNWCELLQKRAFDISCPALIIFLIKSLFSLKYEENKSFFHFSKKNNLVALTFIAIGSSGSFCLYVLYSQEKLFVSYNQKHKHEQFLIFLGSVSKKKSAPLEVFSSLYKQSIFLLIINLT